MEFSTQDLISGQLKDSFKYQTEEQVLRSIKLLSNSGLAWKKLNIKQRQIILLELAKRLEEKKIIFAELITSEMGKPIKDSAAEVTKCITTIKRACVDDLSFLNQREVMATAFKSEIKHAPLGVIYAIFEFTQTKVISSL